MQIIEITHSSAAQVGALVADFRVTLKSYKDIAAKPNIDAGKAEILEYLASGFPCLAAPQAFSWRKAHANNQSRCA